MPIIYLLVLGAGDIRNEENNHFLVLEVTSNM